VIGQPAGGLIPRAAGRLTLAGHPLPGGLSLGVGLGGGIPGQAGGVVLGGDQGDAGVQRPGIVEPGLGGVAGLLGRGQGLLGGCVAGGAVGGGAEGGSQGSLLVGHGLAGVNVLGVQAVQLGAQGPGGLHRLDAGQGGAPGFGALPGLAGLFALRLAFGHAGGQTDQLLVPAQLRFDGSLLLRECVQAGGLLDQGGLTGLADVGLQGHLIGQLGLEQAQGFGFGLGPGVGLTGDLGIGGGAGERLQQFGALVVGGAQKGGKIVLGQEHRTGELLETEADAPLDELEGLKLAIAAQHLAVVDARQAQLAGLQTPLSLAARPPHRPARPVGHAVAPHKIHLGKALPRPPAQQGARVGRADAVLAHVGDGLAPAGRPQQARRGVIKGHAQGIQQRALARTGGAGDGKQAGAGQGLGLEVHAELGGQGGQVATADGKDFHASGAAPAGLVGLARSSLKAPISSAGGASPKRWAYRRWKKSAGPRASSSSTDRAGAAASSARRA
jgi:hypothetical protein